MVLRGGRLSVKIPRAMVPTKATRRVVKSPIAPGVYFRQGNEACADGAVLAGCRFYAGYPITPSSEIMTRIISRFREIGEGRFVQMEDEIASMAAIIGASWAGAKSMTATSGPGFSLMQENIGYAIMTETPCVVVDVQRAGPSTGQATRPAQGDFYQARFGSHGGFPLIAISPWSVQEMQDFTVRAFNLAEKYRVPVILLADEVIGHLHEKSVIPEEVEIYDRWRGEGDPFGAADDCLVPPMPKFGDGKKLLVTGSTHDERGFRRASSPEAQKKLVERFHAKLEVAYDDIVDVELTGPDEYEVLLVAFGAAARTAYEAMLRLNEGGVRVALLRLKTVWPFAERELKSAAQKAKFVIACEMSQGLLVREVDRVVCADAVIDAALRYDGEQLEPADIIGVVEKVRRG